ncbi:MAG: dihydrofolate reductase family protein, partial [Verrucomicrobiales bacterium]|nr:dihydrofolate reductase family protein [Verrucomicrobiales bacterium]
GDRGVVQVLVEGGGEVQASFLLGRLAQRVLFFYAPLVVGGDRARRAVAGVGAAERRELVGLTEVRWRRLGPDMMLTARIGG